ncbi:GAF domain-containing protein [Mycobacterium sp. ITM-2016-00317]|uniref:GAF domain-containing protein n=1 Tax=Mycobacterium sp. ITM-2016-00317 TaxID=2099694 RepID=UPI00287F770E|nr:GAF domain-containing protein [Mycobacterium sp. ITM-2016-00317]WNG90199.1 GAF domain-containing protein [Mycobacterium sp. ITM-2016-00317]
MTSVYRAPMRSRRDDIDPALTFERALSLGLCGFGRFGDPERLARRVGRFADVADGSFVWTRDGDGWYWLGRIDGPYFYDPDGEDVDLVHVRPCTWLDTPFAESRCPAAVVATFGRGGRNFQEIHDDRVGDESSQLWGG